MSANNQTLIQEYKDKWYVFTNLIAESFCDEHEKHINELHIKDAGGVYNTYEEAYEAALKLDAECGEFEEGTEYGVQLGRLVKDGLPVKLVE